MKSIRRRNSAKSSATSQEEDPQQQQQRCNNDAPQSHRKRSRTPLMLDSPPDAPSSSSSPSSLNSGSCMKNSNTMPHVVSPIPPPRATKKFRSITADATIPAPTVIPSSFTCPLTMEIMFDPVLDTEGNSYEKSAILEWLKHSRTSPLSRQPLTERMLIPNVALKSVIQDTMGEQWVQSQQKEQQTNSESSCCRILPKSNNFRAKIDCFLQHTCRELGGLRLSLNDDGCCAFRYESTTVVLDVPERVGVFCLYTKHLVDLDSDDSNNHRLCANALALNFLQGDTRGGCLSIRNNNDNSKEIMFSYTDRVPEVSARDFSNILLNFVETSVVLREKLLNNTSVDSAIRLGPPS